MFASDLALVAITLLWGASFLVTKDLLAGTSPEAILAVRFAIAAATLAALQPSALRRAPPGLWRNGAVLGAFLYVSFALQTFGLAWTTPARGAFLTAGYVFLVPILGWLFGRERIGVGVGVGAVLATVGLALLTGAEVSGEIRRGDVLCALCAVGYAFHILMLGRVALHFPGSGLAIAQLVAAGAVALAVAAVRDPAGLAAFPRLGADALAGVAFLALGCTALSYWVQTWAQRTTPAARAALIFALEPVFAAAFSTALGRETLGLREWAGGALIVGGVLFSEWLRTPAPPDGALPAPGLEPDGALPAPGLAGDDFRRNDRSADAVR